MNIAFVGAYDYGNVGDDQYRNVFKKHLPNHTLSFYNSDKPRELNDEDLLVIGGGGLIYNARNHFNFMEEYMIDAKKKGIPIAMISCGIQLMNKNIRDLKVWKKWFDYAKVITMRSQRGAQIVKRFSSNPNIHYYPDLGYLFSTDEFVLEEPNSVCIIPSRNVHYKNKTFLSTLKANCDAYKRFYILEMGSPNDNRNDIEKLLDLLDDKNFTMYWNPTPETVLNVIKRCRFVITGRYHGMVFARKEGKWVIHFETSEFKFVHEDTSSDMSNAIFHIKKLIQVINDEYYH